MTINDIKEVFVRKFCDRGGKGVQNLVFCMTSFMNILVTKLHIPKEKCATKMRTSNTTQLSSEKRNEKDGILFFIRLVNTISCRIEIRNSIQHYHAKDRRLQINSQKVWDTQHIKTQDIRTQKYLNS